MANFLLNIWNNLRPFQSLNVAIDTGGKRKPTIVLLHGIAATSKTWKPVLDELDSRKYRIVVLDLLGFGESTSPIGCKYEIYDHLRHIRRTLRRLKIRKPFILVGHSMGSIISAKYCREYPREVKSAYLLSLPLYLGKDASQTTFAHASTDIYFRAYDFLLQNKNFTIKNSQLLRKIFNIRDGIEVTEGNWDAFRLSLKNTIINQTTFDDIKNTNVPISIIYGSLDQFLISESINLLSKFENVKITKISTVDHSISPRFAKEVADQITG
jgi:pimeloyl-ACP methyl ester carboxylesterase